MLSFRTPSREQKIQINTVIISEHLLLALNVEYQILPSRQNNKCKCEVTFEHNWRRVHSTVRPNCGIFGNSYVQLLIDKEASSLFHLSCT